MTIKKLLLFLSLTFFFAFNQGAYAQKLQLDPSKSKRNIVKCYTVEVLNEFRKTHPNAETDVQFENWIQPKIQARKAQRALAGNYVIPIVFHILSKGEAIGTVPNVSAASIKQQMLQLNKDYANQSNSPYAIAANTGIQFVLAQTNPQGGTLSEPGIDRINITNKGWVDYTTNGYANSYIDKTVKPGTIWNPNNYYNVWIVPSITSGTSDLLGYSTFPTSSTLNGLFAGETDTTAGVVIQTGTIGSAYAPFSCGVSYGLGKTLSHETGHFLGLRHIWGDAKCGNDFCDDTPVHLTSNSGVPSHPKPNSCGTPDEMFENYMDYSDDIVLNTFTNNQAARMQTVMVNSPRRVSLAASTVGGVAVTASNKINFEDCSGTMNISETGTTGTGTRYKDLNLTLDVEDKATGTATVTIAATGSAINNFHYQLITPSLSFVAGDNYKSIKVRIFDNAEVDGNRSIILNYTISGTGVTAGTASQSLTINIRDDDNISVGSSPVALLNENFGTVGGNFPLNWLSGSFISPVGLNKWRVGPNGGAGITGQALYITDNVVTKPLEYNSDSASDAVVVTPKLRSTGYANGNLSFTYKSNGEADAQGVYDYGRVMYSYDNRSFYYIPDSTGAPLTLQGDSIAKSTGAIPLPMNLIDTAFTIGFRWVNDDNTGNNPPFLIDDILLNVNPFNVETSLSKSYGFDIRAGGAVNNLRSTPNNKMIAVINNTSANISGVSAQITQAGNLAVPLSTLGGSYSRTQKVFQISPTVPNAGVSYQATLYFTEDELAVWGANKLNLKILKLKDSVNLATGTIDSVSAIIVTPVVVENAAAGYITYTGTFTGFSQFMLVPSTTTLIAPKIDFTLQPNIKSITLKFSTLSENNNKGFAIDRSTDSIHFTQINFVKGNGTTASTSNYSFTDNYVQSNTYYYYRIRQVNNDSSYVSSPVHGTKILSTAKAIEITVTPNPASNFVNVFIRGTANLATIELVNDAGQKIKQVNSVNAFDGVYNLPVFSVARGIYSILVVLPEGSFTKRIIVN